MAIDNAAYYRDSAGHLFDSPELGQVEQLKAELAADQRSFTEYGGGFVDFTDNDTVAGTRTALPLNTPWQINRNLTASAANTRLNRPFSGHQFWDNDAKLLRGRALFDIIAMSLFLRVVPDQIGGVLRVALVTVGTAQRPSIEVGGKNMAITAPVSSEESIRADFIFTVRQSFFESGCRLMLTATVPMTLIEASPEFYPLGYEA